MERFFGIALPNNASSRTSRLFRFAERRIWSENHQREAEELSQREGIFRDIESTTRGVAETY